MEEIVLKIIIHAGNAKSMLYEALDYAKENDFKKADELIENANEEILKAHKVQTELIQKEAGGDKSLSRPFNDLYEWEKPYKRNDYVKKRNSKIKIKKLRGI